MIPVKWNTWFAKMGIAKLCDVEINAFIDFICDGGDFFGLGFIFGHNKIAFSRAHLQGRYENICNQLPKYNPMLHIFTIGQLNIFGAWPVML